MVILENNKNEKFKCQYFFMGNASFLTSSLETENLFFLQNIAFFCHRSDQIYHIWKSPLGDPLIILPSIVG